MTDIEIAQAHEMKKIVDVAAKAGIDEKHLELYGNYKAKLDLSEIRKLPRKAKLILVTAISPTPAGEGKTTTSVGLADALNKLGKNTMVCLREPSLGPVFGVKGGAAGGGHGAGRPRAGAGTAGRRRPAVVRRGDPAGGGVSPVQHPAAHGTAVRGAGRCARRLYPLLTARRAKKVPCTFVQGTFLWGCGIRA